jgi:hypothetical protein
MIDDLSFMIVEQRHCIAGDTPRDAPAFADSTGVNS